MRAREFVVEYKTEEYNGLRFSTNIENGQLIVRALDDWGTNELGRVVFNIGDQDELDPQDLEVDDRYQGQGVAKTMYDYVKTLGYEIHRSYDQTDAGKGFWDKHRGEEVRVWEQGVAEGKQPGKTVVDAILKVIPVAQEIWFHGSRATGSHRKNSDTDILVIVPDDLVGDQYLGAVRILQKLSAHFDNHDIQPTKSGTNIHRIAQEEGRLLWSNKQGVAETFNKPYKTKLEKSEYGDIDMLAKLPDGTNLSIMFNNHQDDEGNEIVQVEFYRNNSQEVTGEGNAQRIFATVLTSIQKYIKKYKPARLSFSASKATDPTIYYEPGQPRPNPESRAKLYDRLVQRYARSWGYRAFRADTGDLVIYELSRTNPVAENFADGKNPGRKGLAKRSGVNTKASVSSLRKTAKNSSGEKQRMAHWLANMKAGRAKKK